MTATMIVLLILATPSIFCLLLGAFCLAVWWTRPRHPTPVTPPRVKPQPSKPGYYVCADCGHCQRPDWTACWGCSGTNLYSTEVREPQPHLWV